MLPRGDCEEMKVKQKNWQALIYGMLHAVRCQNNLCRVAQVAHRDTEESPYRV